MTTATLNKAIANHNFATTTDPDSSFSKFKGKTLVLYFYPRDNTPGCTLEAQDFRLLHKKFLAANAEVVGVSRDSLKSHAKFTEQCDLTFPLISDDQEALCSYFNVMKDKNMYGKKVRGVERSTFLIDSNGVLRQEWRGVKVEGHAQEVLEAAKKLQTL
jgi:peroxiredoxin Q/BCP